MSSAKTIADILAFAEVIDPNSYRSSPFTSQPMYIAACAFLTELSAQSSQSIPQTTSPGPGKQSGAPTHNGISTKAGDAMDEPTKHSLLAEKANENYQRCYKSLQQLQEYWGGVTYIINVLDQRSKGTWDCETYTAEEYASTKLPRRPSSLGMSAHPDNLMAWSLTGTTNSPNSTLTRLFQNKKTSAHPPAQLATLQPQPPPVTAPTPPGNWRFDPVRQSLPENTGPLSPAVPQPVVSAVRYSMDATQHGRGVQSMLYTQSAGGSRRASQFDALPSIEATPSTPGSDGRLQSLSSIATNTNAILLSANQNPFTPSSSYESSALHAGSPSSPKGEPGTLQHRANSLHNSNTAMSTDLLTSYGHEFATNGLGSGSFSYMGSAGSIADAIMVEQVDLESMQLPNDMFGPWDLFPGANLDVFDPADLGHGAEEGHL